MLLAVSTVSKLRLKQYLRSFVTEINPKDKKNYSLKYFTYLFINLIYSKLMKNEFNSKIKSF